MATKNRPLELKVGGKKKMIVAKIKELELYDRKYAELLGKYANKKVTKVEFKEEMKRIDEEYDNVLSSIDIKLFDTKENFTKYLFDNFNRFGDRLVKAIEHEEGHYKKARALGVNAKYAVRVLKDSNNNLVACCPAIYCASDPEEILEITKAPTELSSTDELTLNEGR